MEKPYSINKRGIPPPKTTNKPVHSLVGSAEEIGARTLLTTLLPGICPG